MARPRESRENIRQALTELGWEIRTDDEGSGALMGAHGKYHLMVSFEDEKPTSVLVSYVGKGGEILSRKWPGAERLPTPQSVERALS
jgi:Putative bacterial sensory transduction regulator